MSFLKPQSKEEFKRSAIIGTALLLIICVALGLFVNAALSANDDRTDQVKVVVNYSGSWSGAYTDVETLQSWSHDGSYSIVLERSDMAMWIVSANAQKDDDSGAMLTISIQDMDGHVLKTASTSTAYGVAQVAMGIE